MQVRVIEPPAELPVTLEEAKSYLKIDFSNEDQLITRLINAVTDASEKYTGLSFITQTLEAYLDADNLVEIPRGPHQSITSVFNVNYDNTLGDEVTAGNYNLTGFDYLSLFSGYNKFKLSQYRRLNKVRVTYVAGFGDQSQVPDGIKTAILKEVAELYENRENTLVGTIVADLSTTSKTLLHYYKRNVLI
jgi:uncharacterized phiE125 gp8 family phage protein